MEIAPFKACVMGKQNLQIENDILEKYTPLTQSYQGRMFNIKVYNLNCIQKSMKQHKAGFKGENITLKNQGI